MDSVARWEMAPRRRKWSRHWRVPKATRISDCWYTGDPCPPVFGLRLGCHFPETRCSTGRPKKEDLVLQWRLQECYRKVQDLKYYADWYARYSAEERHRRYAAFARKCHQQVRYRATSDGRIPSRSSLPFLMDAVIQTQIYIKNRNRYGSGDDGAGHDQHVDVYGEDEDDE